MNVHRNYTKDIPERVWRDCQAVSRQALTASTDRAQVEIDHFTLWGNPLRYASGHVDPNREVGYRYRAGNSYYNPGLVTAIAEGSIAGFLYFSDNTSGKNPIERRYKHHFVPEKNYLWIGGVAVAPEHQGRGIAASMLRGLIRGVNPRRFVTGYPSPSESPGLVQRLGVLGFHVGEPYGADIYGPNSEPATQVRVSANAGELQHTLGVGVAA